MKVNIVTEKHNPFLKRKEIAVEIEHENESTPTKIALQQYISKELDTEAEKIEIKGIFTNSGLPKSHAKIFIWEEKTVKPREEKRKETKETKTEAKTE